MRLSRAVLDATSRAVADRIAAYPERVIQIGEGNFLRGFADWLIEQLNRHRLFQGRIVVVAPRPTGAANIERLNAQDGLYTVWLRGLVNGQPVDERQIVTSISRGINPHTDWDAVLACAENPDIRIVLSNTTESGVRYQPEPRPLDQAPLSFPGKLTAYLYHRFAHFQGHPDAGMVVVPCELVDDNGAKVRELVLRYAADWQLPESFAEWVTAHNRFCNTLVDRIVTGFPQGTCAEDWEDVLGYADELLTVGEPFHLWVIENAGPLAQWWPFDRIGLNVHYVADAAPYREQKVRILNGSHTAMAGLGLLAGLRTVREVVEHPVLGTFVRRLLDDEVLPVLASPPGGAANAHRAFADAVLERFRNPFVDHQLASLTLNGTAKIQVRLLPILQSYTARFDQLPALLVCALAGQLWLYRGTSAEVLGDHPATVAAVQNVWAEERQVGLARTVERLLALTSLWKWDLNEVPGLAAELTHLLQMLRNHGAVHTVTRVLDRCGVRVAIRTEGTNHAE